MTISHDSGLVSSSASHAVMIWSVGRTSVGSPEPVFRAWEGFYAEQVTDRASGREEQVSGCLTRSENKWTEEMHWSAQSNFKQLSWRQACFFFLSFCRIGRIYWRQLHKMGVAIYLISDILDYLILYCYIQCYIMVFTSISIIYISQHCIRTV